jgi:hypothetical protein
VGQLIEQAIKTIFNGVSRQPGPVRLPSQIQEGFNMFPSVETGGLERRPGTQHITSLGLSASDPYAIHFIDRDENEKYVVAIGDGVVNVFDASTGNSQTVNASTAATNTYVFNNPEDLKFATVADYTFVCNPAVTVLMDPAHYGVAIGAVAGPNFACTGGNSGTLNTGVAHNLVVGDWVNITAGVGADYLGWWQVVTVPAANQTTIERDLDYSDPFRAVLGATPVTYSAVEGNPTGTRNSFSALPGAPATNDVYRIAPSTDTSNSQYYVLYNGSYWVEVPEPGSKYAIDVDTMPIQLVREADGTWSYSAGAWAAKPAGGPTVVPNPPFVNREINDVIFYKNRLCFLTDESAYFTQSGDVFSLWPEKAAVDLATDPFELAASTNRVTILNNAAAFRKELFIASDTTQFEVSGDPFTLSGTNAGARIDPSTFYSADPMCKPVTMADQLYFASADDRGAILYEYLYDEGAASNTAVDITKHARGYLPTGGVRLIVAAPAAERIFVLPEVGRNKLYCYTSYWNGQEKVQSAWTTLEFGGNEDEAYILGAGVLGAYLYLVILRGGSSTGTTFLERMPINQEADDADLGFPIFLDRRRSLTGVYDAGNDWTTFSLGLGYDHGDEAQVVVPWDGGAEPACTYPSSSTVRVSGDYSAAACYVGIPFSSYFEFSPQYVRDENGSSVTSGLLTLRSMTVNLMNSGRCEAVVVPLSRSAKTYRYDGRIGSTAVVGAASVQGDDTFKFRVHSRGDTVRIVIQTDSPLPLTVTGASWVGFYTNKAKAQ